ncbi:MAG: SDR family oxidoreductase [Bryobacterales bacterium]|nr:SDR family oxidoreductase [Bryobacterales bacterium]
MTTIWDLFRLQGKVAVVTGGAGRLGSQMCDALAEAGAHVVVASRNLERCQAKADALLKQGHPRSFAVSTDITNRESVHSMARAVLDQFGKIDILINNAYSGVAKPFEEMSAGEFESSLTGALTGTFLCSQAVTETMRANRSGVIVNIASIYGLVSPDHRIYGRSGLNNPPNYGAAKAGVVQLTRYLATYLAPHQIRVNCITPGGFYDPKLSSRPDYDNVFVRNYESKTPLGRMGNESDLKGAVVYLASEASSYVTGHNLVVDGGWTAW